MSNEAKLKEALERICGLHDQKGDFWKAIADAKALMLELYPQTKNVIPYQWKTIPNFSRYEISTTGEVRRAVNMYKLNNVLLPKGEVLKPYLKKKTGYFGYKLINDAGKQVDVSAHRLVAETYLENQIKRGYIVAHLDGCKTNNDVNNLKWVSNSENQLHRRLHEKDTEYHVARLSVEQVKEAKELYEEGYTQAELSRKYNVSHGVINKMINGVTYRKEVYYA